MNQGLNRLLRPKSIAVIGGGFWCENVIEQCQKIGFEGDIWPVHPSRDTIGDLKAFQDIDALPSAPDASYIGVNREATIDIVRRLSSRGAGGAICFASGFAESQLETGDGGALQAALLDAAGRMTVIGPNCYGLVNYLDRTALWPDQHGGVPVDRGIAILTQSSNIAINLTMQTRGVPIAYVVTVGNQAQTDMAQIGQAVLQDERVTALGLHIEGIKDLRAFEAMAIEARRLGKSVVALKIGASEQAQVATISHTASLAGSTAGANALMQHLGIGQVTSLAAFLETLKLLHVAGPLNSNRIASLSCSGGEASLMADSIVGTNLEFPPLNSRQHKDLRNTLGPKVSLANPLDYHTYIWGDEAAVTATFTSMMDPSLALGIVVLDFPRADRCSPDAWDHAVRAVAKARNASGRPMAILSSLLDTMPETRAKELIALGIVPLCGITEAIEAIDCAARLGTFCPRDRVLVPKTINPGKTLNEAEAKEKLAVHGLHIPKSERTEKPAQSAGRIGFPVVLKGEGIAHKTEAGAVCVGLKSAEEVAHAAATMPTKTFLVEEMVTKGLAELLIGVVCDPAHGYVLTLGTGGTLTELMQDSTSLVLPVSRQDIIGAIKELRINALLDGYRGAQAANKDTIVDAVMAVQSYVTATHPFEVEINPLICREHDAIAVDALIKTGDPDV